MSPDDRKRIVSSGFITEEKKFYSLFFNVKGKGSFLILEKKEYPLCVWKRKELMRLGRHSHGKFEIKRA